MIRNYFKIAWRNLAQNKLYSFINITGLAVGMAVAILIGLWMYDELSFNRYHKNYHDIAQLWGGGTDLETSVTDGSLYVQYPVAEVLKKGYPHYFKQVLLAGGIDNMTLSLANQKFSKKGIFIEEGVLDMLSLTMLNGSYFSLNDPHLIVLSKSAAMAIFGADDPLNKRLTIDNQMEPRGFVEQRVSYRCDVF